MENGIGGNNTGSLSSVGVLTNDSERPNSKMIAQLLNNNQNRGQSAYIDSDNVFNTIKLEAKCVFDKNSGIGNQSLSTIQEKRNIEDLQLGCSRAKASREIDSDIENNMFLGESIGTPLYDARNTQIGSILPLLPPR